MHCNGKSNVDVYNIEDTTSMCGNYIVEVSVEESLPDANVLVDILKYVIPFGYKVNYIFYTSQRELVTDVVNGDEVNIIIVDEDTGSKIVSGDDNHYGALHGIGTTVIRLSRDSGYSIGKNETGVPGDTKKDKNKKIHVKDGITYEEQIN
jgi:hypothetical protein